MSNPKKWLLNLYFKKVFGAKVRYLLEKDVVHDDHWRKAGVGPPHHSQPRGHWPGTPVTLSDRWMRGILGVGGVHGARLLWTGICETDRRKWESAGRTHHTRQSPRNSRYRRTRSLSRNPAERFWTSWCGLGLLSSGDRRPSSWCSSL